jgi:flagellar biosynthesis/type III secretory pathway chaperone
MRVRREAAQRGLARTAGQAESSGLFVLAQVLPTDYRPLLLALVNENNQLLGRVRQRARQNHVLLSRSLELMQQFIQSLAPSQSPTVYHGDGAVHASSTGHVLYEAVG